MSTEVESYRAPNTFEQGKQYINASKQFYELRIFKLLATLSTSLIGTLIIGSMLLFAFVFGAIAGAIALGDVLQNPALGWLIVGFAFIGMAAVVFSVRKKIYRPIIRKLSKTYFS